MYGTDLDTDDEEDQEQDESSQEQEGSNDGHWDDPGQVTHTTVTRSRTVCRYHTYIHVEDSISILLSFCVLLRTSVPV